MVLGFFLLFDGVKNVDYTICMYTVSAHVNLPANRTSLRFFFFFSKFVVHALACESIRFFRLQVHPPLFFEGREATTGNTSAVRRLCMLRQLQRAVYSEADVFLTSPWNCIIKGLSKY